MGCGSLSADGRRFWGDYALKAGAAFEANFPVYRYQRDGNDRGNGGGAAALEIRNAFPITQWVKQAGSQAQTPGRPTAENILTSGKSCLGWESELPSDGRHEYSLSRFPKRQT